MILVCKDGVLPLHQSILMLPFIVKLK